MSDSTVPTAPPFWQAFQVWTRIGLLSFGGPAGQIALMHRTLVEEKKWLPENRFLHALNFCMLLPGPEAMQLATYAGWMMHGVRGGLAAGLMFVLPGACVVFALAMLYAGFGRIPLVEAIFLGVKAAVLIIVVQALLKIANRALKHRGHWLIAAAAFIAIFAFSAPYPLIVLAAGLVGWFALTGTATTDAPASSKAVPVPLHQTVRTLLTWLAIWFLPLAAVAVVLGSDHVLTQSGIFFSKLAVVTFGGAYAVLAYMAQEVVEGFRWLTAGEMLDGLGLAETTPGPLILVTEFVGTLAAARDGGGFSFSMALVGAVVALWATFAPCFLWIFVFAPYIDRLGENARLKSALSGVTAAVVGVILNLSLWFTLHVLFATVDRTRFGPLHLWIPDISTIDVRALGLSIVALFSLLVFKQGILTTLLLCATLSGAWFALG